MVLWVQLRVKLGREAVGACDWEVWRVSALTVTHCRVGLWAV